MKLLYIAQSLGKMSGVKNKVYAQCEAFEKNGYETSLFSWGVVKQKMEPFPSISGTYKFFDVTEQKDSHIRNVIKRRYRMFPVLYKLIKALKPDIIYLRYPLADPAWIVFLLLIHPIKLIVEHNTLELQELSSQHNFLGFTFEFLFGKFFRLFPDQFVAVTDEILLEQRKRAWPKSINGIVIGNGFNVSSVKLRTLPELGNEIRILGVANLAYWHGYDRILRGIAAYHGKYNIVFHLAGGAGKAEIQKLKELAKELNISDNLITYEPLYGERLDNLYDYCHIAAGSLGGHRKNLNKSSELKLREYCARGIPFFISLVDDDFKNFEYELIVPSNETPIDICEIVNFVQKVYLISDLTTRMRIYAFKYIDWFQKLDSLFR